MNFSKIIFSRFKQNLKKLQKRLNQKILECNQKEIQFFKNRFFRKFKENCKKNSRDLFVHIFGCDQRLFFSSLRLIDLQNARGSSRQTTARCKFEATTPMPSTRKVDADAVTAAVAAALARTTRRHRQKSFRKAAGQAIN